MVPDDIGEASGKGMPPPAPDPPYYRIEPADAAKIRVLIVEDDGVIALHTADVLEKAGFSVLTPVAYSEEALKHLDAPPLPDLFLMDIRLAGKIDGIETARQIMERSGTPVIFMSAWSDNPRIIRAALTKPYGYLVKPVNDRELLATVATSLYRHAVDRKLAESEGRYRAVVDNAAEGILLVNCTTLDPVEANPAFLQLTGYGVGDRLPGIREILFSPQGMEDAEFSRILFEGGRLRDVRLKRRDGSFREADVASSVVSRKDEPAILTILTHDVTDRKRAEAALSAANKKLNLLSEVTRHDILNQLTKLRGWIEISQDVLDDRDKISEYFEKEIRSADAITSLILFTRDYQNMGISAPVWQDVPQVIKSAVPPSSRIEVIVEDGLYGLEVYADTLFPKVITNLIDNTLRHGGEAASALRFSARREGRRLTLVAEDNGTGIPEGEKEKIFLRGFGKNTGLGLFLSREILGITGFSIGETGEPGRGARFEIAVPEGMYRFEKSRQPAESTPP